MSDFFELTSQKSNNLAVVDGKKRLSYLQIRLAVKARKAQIKRELAEFDMVNSKHVIALYAENTLETLLDYLALIQLRQVIMFVNDRQAKEVQQSPFFPIALLHSGSIRLTHVRHSLKYDIYPELSMLLSTSGSTGTQKYVALSYRNILANTQSICEYLPICETDKTITTLPFQYVYGLSIINTHLSSGACIVMTKFSLMQREFWKLFEDEGISSFGGVPYSYELLFRLKFFNKPNVSLRYLTQAGGKLDAQKVKVIVDFVKANQIRFFCMYGQTEASARMAYASERLLEKKPETIGNAIPNTKLRIESTIQDPKYGKNNVGELVFEGQNVMLGYAQNADDLAKLSPSNTLFTGDLGYVDREGHFFISGRKKRFIKLFGERINLDEIHNIITSFLPDQRFAVTGNDKGLIIAIEKDVSDPAQAQDLNKKLSKTIGLHASVIKTKFVEQLPINSNQKIDYAALNKMLEHG